jgi:hypothetical protein
MKSQLAAKVWLSFEGILTACFTVFGLKNGQENPQIN